jgi:hypothetical protein
MPQYGYDDFVNELRRYPKSPQASKGKRLAHQSILNWSRESEETKSLAQRLKERRAIEAEMKLLAERLEQLQFVSGEMSQVLQRAPPLAIQGHVTTTHFHGSPPRISEPQGNSSAPRGPSGLGRPLRSTQGQGERVVVQWVPIEPLGPSGAGSSPSVNSLKHGNPQTPIYPEVDVGAEVMTVSSSRRVPEPTSSTPTQGTARATGEVPSLGPGDWHRPPSNLPASAPRLNAAEVRLQLHGLQGRLHHYMILLEELEQEARNTLMLEGLTPAEVERILALRLGVRREQEALGHREAILADADLRLEVLLEVSE